MGPILRKDAAFRLSLAFVGLLAGCTPSIGDKCVLSTDCSIRGDRLCDTSQPDGYCTVFNCRGNLCPDTATCILFHPSVQGCGFDDRSPSRTGRSFCVKRCESDDECRPGYVCTDPRLPPWNAAILDNWQEQRSCLPRPVPGAPGTPVDSASPVCQAATPSVPQIDASPPRIVGTDETPDATVPVDAGSSEGGPDAGAGDAAGDAPEGG
jgi:hypothetical protein